MHLLEQRMRAYEGQVTEDRIERLIKARMEEHDAILLTTIHGIQKELETREETTVQSDPNGVYSSLLLQSSQTQYYPTYPQEQYTYDASGTVVYDQ